MEVVNKVFIYQGGSVEGTKCVWCSTPSTSGSWRRGWRHGSDHVNLCNKCGQRWVKLGKPSSYQETIQAEERKARGERLLIQPTPSADQPKSVQHKRQDAPANTTNKRQRSRLTSDISTDSLGFDSDDTKHDMGLEDLEVSMNFPLDISGRSNDNKLPDIHSINHDYVSHAFQKVSTTQANHALFWVQDSDNNSVLAIVGTDGRKSGHFIYKSVPQFTVGHPLSLQCTNRNDATAWLARAGIATSVPDDNLYLPTLTTDEIKSAVLPGARLIVVSANGERSSPVPPHTANTRPGRLLLGGAKVKPGSLPSLNIGFNDTTSAHHYQQKPLHLKVKAHSSGAPLQLRCGACGSTEHGVDECYYSCISPPALVDNGDVAAFDMLFDDPLVHFESDIDVSPGYDHLPFPEDLSPINDHIGQYHHTTTAGIGSQMAEKAHNNMHTNTAFITHSDSTQHTHYGGNTSPGAMSRPNPPGLSLVSPTTIQGTRPTVPTTTVAQTVDILPSVQQPTFLDAARGPFAATKGRRDHLQTTGGHLKLTAEAQAAYTSQPELLGWVSRLPTAAQEETFKQWASQLMGHISATPPPPRSNENQIPVHGFRWTPLSEALGILDYLSKAETSLKLLERTQVSRAVAMLRTHPISSVATAAEAIVTKWRSLAQRTLETRNLIH